ncbi:MAG TPA: sigma-70 family RNA polymerase sigma factor [Longimicrobiales bacterium]|nr:sigma-70 family RNA polymerase sigma factor [Longimicrobiales bacterium]
MYANPKRLRSPEQRVGTLPNADLPPPVAGDSASEPSLVDALRAGDETAFERLLDRYYSPMLRLASSYVRSREEAEEVVQDTWLAVLAGIDRFQERSSFRTWLFRILVNRARTRAKREARSVPFSTAFAADSPRSGDPAGAAPVASAGTAAATTSLESWPALTTTRTPIDELLAGELRQRIDAAIAELPARQRAVITLRDVEGWSAEEVRNVLRLTETNQRVLLHRARIRVRDALVPYLASPDDDGNARLVLV